MSPALPAPRATDCIHGGQPCHPFASSTTVDQRSPAGGPGRCRRPGHHLTAIVAIVLMLAGAAVTGLVGDSPTALAVVVHQQGFDATVKGWSSWYGAYGLGALGSGWCVDHGAHAPDAAFGYVAMSLDGEVDPDTQAAMAWAASTSDPSDAVTAAATMLVLHDLRRAVYPYGVIDLDHMSGADLAGFGGREADILTRARAIKADAWAHASLRAPFQLTLQAPVAAPGSSATVVATLTDAAGRPVAGAPVSVAAAGATLTTDPHPVTTDTGSVGVSFVAATGDNLFAATAVVPDPRPRIFGSSTQVAQRIIAPATVEVSGRTAFATSPPTTAPPTTTASPTTRPTTTPPTVPPTSAVTTTTQRPTTTTVRPPETTTTRVPRAVPPTTTPPTTTAPSTSTSSSSPSSTTTSTSPPPPTVITSTPPPESPPMTPPRTTRPSLPVTGSSTMGLTLLGAGLLCLGVAAVGAAGSRRRSTRPGATTNPSAGPDRLEDR